MSPREEPLPANPATHEEFGGELNRNRAYLMALARSHLAPDVRRRVSASDVVQETMAEAYRDREQFRGGTPSELTAWLRGILAHNLVNLARDQRRAKRDVAAERSLEAALRASSARWFSLLDASRDSPSQGVAREEELLLLASSLEAMSEVERRTIELRYLEGRTLEDISRATESSHYQVAQRLRKGLAELRRRLDGDQP